MSRPLCLSGLARAFSLGVLLAFAALLVLGAFTVGVPRAYADDLKVYVGYSGGPYYLKHEYSDSDLWALANEQGGQRFQYSYVDRAYGRLVKAYGWGPTLESVFTNAYDSSTGTAVNPNELWRFHMGTVDNYIPDDSGIENGGYGFQAWWWRDLSQGTAGALGMTRWCYPTLGGTTTYTDETGHTYELPNFDYEEDSINLDCWDAIEAAKYEVPTIIALRSSWCSVTSTDAWNAQDGPSTPEACSTKSNRLLFGQTALNEVAAVASAHSVNAILCIYSGTPDIEVTTTSGESSFYGDIGETITAQATVKAADQLIVQEAAKNIDWHIYDENGDDVSDEYGLTVNDDGTVSFTIAGNGNVSVSAHYGNSSNEAFTSSGSMGGGGPHSDYDPSWGSGYGYGGNGEGGGGGGTGGNGGGQGSGGTVGTETAGGSDGADASSGGASGSMADYAVDAAKNYVVEKLASEDVEEYMQDLIDLDELPWGLIILVLALLGGAAAWRIGAYLWDVDRRKYLRAKAKTPPGAVSAS